MRSKRIVLHDEEKLSKINPETAQIMQRYKIDMSMRNLSPRTQQHYIYDLEQWFIYIYDKQQNRSVKELTDDDITEFIYFCMNEGNNSERIKLRLARCTIQGQATLSSTQRSRQDSHGMTGRSSAKPNKRRI